MKTQCTKCGAKILITTAEYNAGMCAICGGIARAIAWRRSTAFIFIALVFPALLLAFACWQLSQRQWAWGWALVVLLPLLIRNFKLRKSTEPPPC